MSTSMDNTPNLERCARHLEILLSAFALGEIVFTQTLSADVLAGTSATLAAMTRDAESALRDLNLEPLAFSALNPLGRVQ